MMRYGWSGMGLLGGWIGMLLGALLICVLIVLAVLMVIRMIRFSGHHDAMHGQFHASQGNSASNGSNALKILDERFAKGEIDEEEYKKKKEMIMKS